MELEVVWNGSHKDVYLCVHPVHILNLDHVQPATLRTRETAPYRDWSLERAHAMELLATRERWRIRDLRCCLGLTPPVMSGIMQRLRRDRLVRSVGHGYVAWRRTLKQAAA